MRAIIDLDQKGLRLCRSEKKGGPGAALKLLSAQVRNG